jgi:hypothetical protein
MSHDEFASRLIQIAGSACVSERPVPHTRAGREPAQSPVPTEEPPGAGDVGRGRLALSSLFSDTRCAAPSILRTWSFRPCRSGDQSPPELSEANAMKMSSPSTDPLAAGKSRRAAGAPRPTLGRAQRLSEQESRRD